MAFTKQSQKNVNVKDLLNQYEKMFDESKKDEQVTQSPPNNEKNDPARNEVMVQNAEQNALISFNNKDNPAISIFDAYAFNEVMRRYENSIVQLTRQELEIKDYTGKIEDVKEEYEQKMAQLKANGQEDAQLRETLDQINIILDEKDDKIVEYSTLVDKKESEINKIRKELKEKEAAIKKMESQLYSVLFKVSESNTLV
jgi:chromosome segregation ATPase